MNTTVQYKFVGAGAARTIVVVLDGRLRTIGAAHINADRIATYLLDGGTDPAELRSLLNVRHHIATRFRTLSERVAFDGDRVLFDGDPLDNNLSRHLVRMLREGADVRPVVAFLEKLAANPSRLSKIHLWSWLTDRDFTITPAGDVIGYKGVQATPDNLSIYRGTTPARVNNRTHTGHVPNPLGAVVSVPRSAVDPDRDHGCSVGLHVGTWDYASNWAGPNGRVLTVAVNPRDVVAVPRDCEFAKMRVCQYTVLDVTTLQLDTALYPSAHDDLPDDPDHDLPDNENEHADTRHCGTHGCDLCDPPTAFAVA